MRFVRGLQASIIVMGALAIGCSPSISGPGAGTGANLGACTDDCDPPATPAACVDPTQLVTPSSASLANALTSITADHAVTADEWTNVLSPIVATLAKNASADSRALVALWHDATVTFDPSALSSLQAALQAQFGYSIFWDSQPTQGSLAWWLQRNITETDFDLDCLAALVGSQGSLTTAILDTGFDYSNPALTGKIWTNPGEIPGNGVDDESDGLIDDINGWDFLRNVAALDDPTQGQDSADHGTDVSGLATGGSTALQAMGLRISTEFFVESTSAAQNAGTAAAIDYAAAHGARFINRSGPVPGDVTPVTDAIGRHPEVLFTFASGDDGAEVAPGQAQYALAALQLPNVVMVAAAAEDGTPASYSSHSATLVDVAAPGDAISTWGMKDQEYGGGSGTSMSAPIVLNVAAKCALLAPSLTPIELKKILYLATEKDPAWAAIDAASGTVNAHVALRIAALTALVRAGKTPDQAADTLMLMGDERTSLIALQQLL
jgi:hypothetical protein